MERTQDTVKNRKGTNLREERDSWLKHNRFAGIILVNPEAEALLQLRSKDDYLYPNCWTLPGGRVEEGESFEQAILREVKEELGLDLRGHNLFKTIVENTLDETTERHIYWGDISERIEDLKLGEGAAWEYFSLGEILRLDVGFDLKPVITDFLKTHATV
jgi:8-oxo-dGTP pyrophosphatase MutT (NUDIX family)